MKVHIEIDTRKVEQLEELHELLTYLLKENGISVEADDRRIELVTHKQIMYLKNVQYDEIPEEIMHQMMNVDYELLAKDEATYLISHIAKKRDSMYSHQKEQNNGKQEELWGVSEVEVAHNTTHSPVCAQLTCQIEKIKARGLCNTHYMQYYWKKAVTLKDNTVMVRGGDR